MRGRGAVDNMEDPEALGWAFKEWSWIVKALEEGRQSLILRKGGIHEGREGFRVSHSRFWLFPTEFHQQLEQLSQGGQDWTRQLAEPNSTELQLRSYAEVSAVVPISDEVVLERLEPLHFWSTETIHARFHYRQPGLYLLAVRIFRLPTAHVLSPDSQFGGCRSWVELPTALSTNGGQAVLDDRQFHHEMDRLQTALLGTCDC
ncbi:MAG: DUF1802 family protein [Planctomycetaceae bacterium]|nr:DUF1802 family protein [Planctomycetaceae bacterium]